MQKFILSLFFVLPMMATAQDVVDQVMCNDGHQYKVRYDIPPYPGYIKSGPDLVRDRYFGRGMMDGQFAFYSYWNIDSKLCTALSYRPYHVKHAHVGKRR